MFTTINDVANPTMAIIRHDVSGFYNITKALAQYYELNPDAPVKKVAKWTRLDSAKALIESVKQAYGLDEAIYSLHANTRNEHKGTYAHSALYRAFLSWISPDYAIGIFAIIEKSQSEYTKQLEAEKQTLSTEKTSLELLIESIHTKLDDITDSNKRLEKDRDEAKKDRDEAKKDRDEAKFNLKSMETRMTKQLDTVVTMLQEKSIVSTTNPADENKHHHFVCMGYKFIDRDTGKQGRSLKYIAGQDGYVRNAMRKQYDDKDHDWTPQIEKHYNANPIDLRNNISRRVKELVYEAVVTENAKRSAEVERQNKLLKAEIQAYNKANPKAKRVFSSEKIKVVKITTKDIPITCTTTRASYIENDFISYDELIDAIIEVNAKTQASPYQSDAGESDHDDELEEKAPIPPTAEEADEANTDEEVTDNEELSDSE